MHVHWLQQDKGCGKIMQDVAIHSSLASKSTNNNNVKCAARRSNKDDNDVTAETNIVPPPTAFSITKLRLKSNLPPLPANKRPLEENLSDETLLKRSKFVDNLKSKMSTMLSDNILLNFNNDLEIKEEPLDEDDIMNTTPLSPEVIIKTEEEQAQTNNEMRICENVCEQSVPQTAAIIDQMKMKSLLINNNNEINPEFQGKINVLSPMPPLQMINNNIINNNHKIIIANNNLNDKIVKNLNNNIIFNCNNNIIPNNVIPLNNGNNNSLKNITNLKFVRLASAPLGGMNNRLPPNIQLISLQQQQNEQQVSIQQQQQSQQLQQEFKVIPAPKMSLQIFKLLPGNALTLKNDQPQQILTTNNGSGLLQQQQQPMNIIKLQKAPIIVGPQIQQNNFQLNKLSTVSPDTVAAGGAAPDIENTNTVSSNPDVPAQDEFTRLQAEAMQKAEEHRIQYISKKNLIAIESLPEKKQLIDKLKKQIAKVVVGNEVQSNDKTSVSPPPLMKISKDIEQTIKMPNSPISLYLPIMSSVDVELVEARYKFPDYNYKFICPYCLKDYDIKRCLKSHLTKAHNLTTRDMDKINVQAKPFKQEGRIDCISI